ncbi:diguanylate cyclase/phosphodiesterase [Ancylobacter novellus DSM 506]|uniref:Diguanylate cyclase/phosphodiesterase n=1 Tax=Ancylobacter novellus (strain ATCC 8093 / DSM 506 / JCM 20403 / CCM 1077 / IAM 12100 / NBRC 12443 / NCIMB 10456) TaxID=639283 RepID=D7A5R3_ANCN5|nr:EAL domain-containing protein [Ancylobacter novellus]ADH90028.1 diguanylate cyclase/phosphodiesterase [Ancylobacter novellus DSM 506]
MPKHETLAESGPDAVLPPASVAEAVRALGAASYRWTLSDDLVRWSAAAEEVLGRERMPLALRGRNYAELIEPGSGNSRHDAALASMQLGIVPGGDGSTRFFETVYCLALPPGSGQRRLWVEDRGVCHFDAEGGLVRVDGFLRRLAVGRPVRIGLSRGAEPKTDRQRLAGLIEERLSLAYREDSEFGFVLVGVDHLGDLNDAYGFLVADEVIDVIWLRLRAQLAEGEELARFSGSKFGLLLRAQPGEGFAPAARRFLATVNATPPRTSAGAVAATVSAGGLIAPRQGRTVSEIFAHAQDTLHRARRSARGTLEMYSPALDRAAERHANVRFADEIVDALDEDRVSLAFQPIACGQTRAIAFHECLARITGRDGRMHDGATIIPTADRFGLTRLVDGRAMELALAALRADPAARLSVNVSPGSINDAAWLGLVEEGARAGLSSRLIVEITESTTIPDMEAMRARIAWLRGHGCKVAMDDFGVGYTSFRNLRSLHVDMLKIDGSFIATMMQSEDDRSFVRVLLDLAGQLGIETVAEWVLDEETGSQLVEWGCTYLQGELIGLPADSPSGGAG